MKNKKEECRIHDKLAFTNAQLCDAGADGHFVHCKTEHMQTEGHGAGEGNFEGNKRTMLSSDLPRYITILFICDLERTSELCEHLAVHTEITNEID